MTDTPHEFSVIRDFFSFSERTASVAVGVGDDAAIIRPAAGTELVVAVDTLVESVHFPAQAPAAAVGHRALAVNLSDLAAMGATPRWATLALTLPEADTHWLADFSGGLRRTAVAAEVALIGGDTTRGALTISVSVIGETPTGSRLLRSGAKPGDELWVSGSLGDAAAGLDLLQSTGGASSPDEQFLVDRFLWPTPRQALGVALRDVANAAIDVSDGLLADLDHLLVASDAGAVLQADSIPVSKALHEVRGEGALELALTGGDDYELLFAVAPERRHEIPRGAASQIGVITESSGIRLRRGDKELTLPAQSGFNHFRAPA